MDFWRNQSTGAIKSSGVEGGRERGREEGEECNNAAVWLREREREIRKDGEGGEDVRVRRGERMREKEGDAYQSTSGYGRK